MVMNIKGLLPSLNKDLGYTDMKKVVSAESTCPSSIPAILCLETSYFKPNSDSPHSENLPRQPPAEFLSHRKSCYCMCQGGILKDFST